MAVRIKKNTSSNKSNNRLETQVANYRERFKAANQPDPTDTRNWFEKWANLEEDQNVLFDIFELIGRPQQMLYGAIDSATKGENILEGAKEGFTGERKLTGKELLTDNFGWEDSDFNLLDLSTYKDIKPSDVVGFASDIFLDPIDFGLLVATVGTGGAASPALAAKLGVDTLDTAGDVARGIKAVDKSTDIAKTTYKFAPFQKGAKSISDLGFEYAGKGIKKLAKGADTLIESGLGKLDANTINKATKYALDHDMSTVDALAELKLSTDKLQTYKNLKKLVNNTVDSAKNIKGFIGRSRRIADSTDFDKLMGKAKKDEISKLIDNVVSKLDEAGTKVSHDEISKRLVNAIQSEKDWTLTGQDIINRLVEGEGRANLVTKEQAEGVLKILDQFGIKAKMANEIPGNVDDMVRILKDAGIDISKEEIIDNIGAEIIVDDNSLKDIYTIQDALFDPATRQYTNDLGVEGLTTFKDLDFGSKNLKRVNEQLKVDREFFEQTPELQELYNRAQNAVKDFATTVSDASKGLDAGAAATTDYVKASRTEDLRSDSTKIFSKDPNYDAAILQNNLAERQKALNETVNKMLKNEDLQKSIYKVDENGDFLLDESGNFIRDDVKYKETVDRLNARIDRAKNSIDAINKVNLAKTTGIVEDFENLPKKYQKQINDIAKLLDLQELDLANKLETYKKLAPESREYVDEIIDGVKALEKEAQNTKRLIKNKDKALKQFNDPEFIGRVTVDDAIKAEYDKIKQIRNRLKTAIREADVANSKEVKNAIKEVGKAFKKGKEVGIKQAKTSQKLANQTKKVDAIRQANGDMLENLNRKLNLDEQRLLQLEDADAVYNKVTARIDKNVEQIEILKSVQGQNFFKDSFEEAFEAYVEDAVVQNAGTKKFYDALSNHLFDNEEYVRLFDANEDVPFGYARIKGNSLIKKLDSYKPVMTDEGIALAETLTKFKDKDIIIDKQFATALNVTGKKPHELMPLVKVMDDINNTFKKFSTLTLGFHTRNILGNISNMVLSGANARELPKYYKEAISLMNNAKDLINKANLGKLVGDELEQFKKIKRFYEAGFADAITKGYGLDAVRDAKKGLFKNISKKSLEANNYVDSLNRMSLMLYADDHADYISKLGRQDSVDAVKHVLFDPSNMSDVEQEAFRRIIPFYTFTKQNLVFQVSNIMKNSPRYNKLFKSLNKSYSALPDDSYYDYQKENMQIPLPFVNEDGTQLFLKANLPIAELGQYLGTPIDTIKQVASATNPLIKTPFELATGVSTYTGEPVYANTLNNLANTLGMPLSKGTQDTFSMAEQILNSFGFQNVTTNLVKKVDAILNSGIINQDKSGEELWAEIFRSVLQATNEENVRNSGLYDDLEAYQAEVRRLKNQGIDIPTIQEITASNKIKLNNLKTKRANSK